jgi:CLIP-associating protein 1/2
VGELLKELSNPSERPEERRGALVELLKIAREDSLAVWEEHFKTMLLLLLETLSDQDVRTLEEMINGWMDGWMDGEIK